MGFLTSITFLGSFRVVQRGRTSAGRAAQERSRSPRPGNNWRGRARANVPQEAGPMCGAPTHPHRDPRREWESVQRPRVLPPLDDTVTERLETAFHVAHRHLVALERFRQREPRHDADETLERLWPVDQSVSKRKPGCICRASRMDADTSCRVALTCLPSTACNALRGRGSRGRGEPRSSCAGSGTEAGVFVDQPEPGRSLWTQIAIAVMRNTRARKN